MKDIKKSVYNPTRASTPKRLAAYIVDVVLFLVLFSGITLATSYIVGYQSNNDALVEKYIETGVYELNENNEYVFCDTSKPDCMKAWEDFNKDKEACYYYDHATELTTIILTASVFLTYAITELAIPLILKNGRTLGMFCFRICMIDKQGIKVKPIQVFVRFLFGKFLVTTMIPIYGVIFMAFNLGGGLLGFLTAVVILGVDVLMSLFTENKTGIANSIAGVYAVDSETTIMFDTIEELNAKKCEEQRIIDSKRKIY